MDAVRAAVGDDKLTYLGYSYGTLLGATYAQLYPQRVRALVLDGAVDPQQRLVEGSESQARGFERAFTNFARWCAANAGRCPIAPDARAAVTSAIDKAKVSPVRGADGREATAGWVFYAVISSLYTESGWQELAQAIDKLRRGRPEGRVPARRRVRRAGRRRALLEPVRRQPGRQLRRRDGEAEP